MKLKVSDTKPGDLFSLSDGGDELYFTIFERYILTMFNGLIKIPKHQCTYDVDLFFHKKR